MQTNLLRDARPDLRVSRPETVDAEDWDFSGADTQYLLHSLHPYPARFIPQIPRRGIERWSNRNDLVLDPFCGCGTTLLEAALLGRNSVGIDNNGVATLVASAKVQLYGERDFTELERLTQLVAARASSMAPQVTLDEAVLDAPDYPGKTKWFDDRAWRDLARLRGLIRRLRPPSRTLAFAVLSSIVVQVSNQDSDTRYAAVDRAYRPQRVFRLWAKRMADTIPRARETMSRRMPGTHEVHTADSRTLPFLSDSSVNLIVTSPPYLNAYDYHKYHRHRLHWIDADVRLARDVEIGKHDVFTRPAADPTPYFEDLRRCMMEWARVLKPGGSALVVVGDAIVSGQFVPVGDRLADVAGEVGLSLERRWIRHLDKSRKSFNPASRISREHLLLFRAGK